jgi:multisubunit Na+/H+ antiporter MnhB subunit
MIMTMVELCQSPLRYLAMIAMLFFIFSIVLCMIHFGIYRFRDRNKLIHRIEPIIKKAGIAFFSLAIVLVVLYLVLPIILNVLVGWNVIEPVSCMNYYQPASGCGESGNITKCGVLL